MCARTHTHANVGVHNSFSTPTITPGVCSFPSHTLGNYREEPRGGPKMLARSFEFKNLMDLISPWNH